MSSPTSLIGFHVLGSSYPYVCLGVTKDRAALNLLVGKEVTISQVSLDLEGKS